MPFGIKVSSSETAQSAGTALSTGTAFITSFTDYGPFTPQLVKSLAAYTALYGERTATDAIAYDTVQTYFTLNGGQAYIQRAGGEAGAVAALAELETAVKAKTLVISARYKGVQGNKLKYKVGASGEIIVINGVTEEVLETIVGAKAESFFSAGETETKTAYITITQGSNYGTGKTEALKEVAAATALTTGANPTATAWTTGLAEEALTKLATIAGPGQLLIPGYEGEQTKEAIHKVMGEHAQKYNRFALCDIKDASSTATLITNRGTLPAVGIAGYMAFFSSSCTIPGVTGNTTRKVPGSAVAAALCAQVASSGNDNQAPCGAGWAPYGGVPGGISTFVSNFTNVFTLEQMTTLYEGQINSFYITPNGTPCLYGFVSALPYSSDKIFWQSSASRERMRLKYEAEQIAERFLFKTIDGRGLLLSKFQGELQGLVAKEWKKNALFGETASEAGVANVGEPVNTPTTEQAGELNAELKVRLSPYANSVAIVVVSVPITESVGA